MPLVKLQMEVLDLHIEVIDLRLRIDDVPLEVRNIQMDFHELHHETNWLSQGPTDFAISMPGLLHESPARVVGISPDERGLLMSAKSRSLPLRTLVIDARELEGLLTDLVRGSMRGMRTTRKGFDEVVAEIIANHKRLGVRSPTTDADIQRLRELNELVAKFDKYLPAIEKLYELVRESRAVADDARERHVLSLAKLVEARAELEEDRALRAQYEKTRSYRSEPGVKAHATRRRKKKANGE